MRLWAVREVLNPRHQLVQHGRDKEPLVLLALAQHSLCTESAERE